MSVPAAAGFTARLPDVASLPVHAPLAVQAVALVDDQLSVALLPRVIDVGETASVTVGAGACTVSTAEALLLPPVPVQVKV